MSKKQESQAIACGQLKIGPWSSRERQKETKHTWNHGTASLGIFWCRGTGNMALKLTDDQKLASILST